MEDVTLAARLPAVVERSWGRRAESVRPLGGGLNSATCQVLLEAGPYVAKWVSNDYVAGATAGLAEARLLADRGLATGPPLPARDGSLAVPLEGGMLALLAWVPGVELTGDTPADQALMGATLGRAHTLGDPTVEPTRRFFTWFDERSPFLDAHPDARSAVVVALAAYDALPPLTWGLLHTDPAPEAFRHDPATGETGLIDWTGACRGPLLYDVASALMYLGPSPAFREAYLTASPLPHAELDHLDVLTRYRGAVQVAYFADRVARSDLTGTDDTGNRQGLEHGLRMLETAGGEAPEVPCHLDQEEP